MSQANVIPYAPPENFGRPRLVAAVWIAFIGLALILLGGCFLIGVMGLLSPSFRYFNGSSTISPLRAWGVVLMIVLYVCAFGCFGGAIALLIRGLRILFQIVAS